jgi:putative acetyltransferase
VLETEASKLAERFFMRRGWHLVARQSVDRGGVAIPNAVMRKPLTLREAVA